MKLNTPLWEAKQIDYNHSRQPTWIDVWRTKLGYIQVPRIHSSRDESSRTPPTFTG